MQLLHLGTHHRHLLLGEFSCTIVVRVPFIMPHVPLQLTFGFLSFILLSAECSLLLLRFIQIAFVVASCRTAMVFPTAHAGPAEFVTALIATHVVTPLILLDRLCTPWALPCVCYDPGHVLGLCVYFHIPDISCLTIGGPVWAQPAPKTRLCVAHIACNILQKSRGVGTLTGDSTLNIRAPLDVAVVVGKRFAEPLPVHGLFFDTGVQHA